MIKAFSLFIALVCGLMSASPSYANGSGPKSVKQLLTQLSSSNIFLQASAAHTLSEMKLDANMLELVLDKGIAYSESSDATLRKFAARILGQGIENSLRHHLNALFPRKAFLALTKLAQTINEQRSTDPATVSEEESVRSQAFAQLANLASVLQEGMNRGYFANPNFKPNARHSVYVHILEVMTAAFMAEKSENVRDELDRLLKKAVGDRRSYLECQAFLTSVSYAVARKN